MFTVYIPELADFEFEVHKGLTVALKPPKEGIAFLIDRQHTSPQAASDIGQSVIAPVTKPLPPSSGKQRHSGQGGLILGSRGKPSLAGRLIPHKPFADRPPRVSNRIRDPAL